MDWRVQKVIFYMKSNLHRKLCLNEIAQSVGLSPSRLSHLFRDGKKGVGMTPLECLQSLRMQRARELLHDPLLSIKQIRLRVGIRDKSYFATLFRRTYGVTPSRYREKVLTGNIAEREPKSLLERLERGRFDPRHSLKTPKETD